MKAKTNTSAPKTHDLEICGDCRLYHGLGESPEVSDSDLAKFEASVTHLHVYTLDIHDQWTNSYNEFSVSTCGSCGTTTGGERYGCTATLFNQNQESTTI